MRRLLYFAYFINNANFRDILSKINLVNQKEDMSKLKIMLDMIYSSFKFKSSFEDYFEFEFYNKSIEERNTYLTTGKAYEFHNLMNKKEKRYIFKEKNIFMKKFDKFIKRDYLFLKDNFDDFNSWVSDKNQFIAKPNEGAVGRGIEIVDINKFENNREIFKFLKKNSLDLIEELIEQKDELNMINPSSVNTLRIVTVTKDNNTDIVGALLRMSKGNFVDNLARGGGSSTN